MKLVFIFVFSLSSLISYSQINLLKKVSEQAESLINTEVKLSEQDIADGLIETLISGSSYSANLASSEGGFNNSIIRIPFPDEAIKIKTSLLQIGFKSKIEEFENCINKAAETASEKAFLILLESIREMSIEDVFTILNGEDNAATVYLKNDTYEFLYSEFKPIIFSAMQKVDVAKTWNPLIEKYNTIPFIQKINPDLEDYITTKTIEGLFILISQQEKEIRTNPEARVSELLQKVFK
jgi:hypothetical protein